MAMRLLVLLNLIIHVFSFEEVSSRIVIVGSGASGIAAASRLLQNGFNDITILEAEDRIGGRVYSVQIGEYLMDLGGQWVIGEKNNAAFQLAWPLGLLEKSADQKELNYTFKYFNFDGGEIPADSLNPMLERIIGGLKSMNEDITGSLGDVVEKEFNEYVKTHPEISPDQYKPLLHFLDIMKMSDDGAVTWDEVSAKGIKL